MDLPAYIKSVGDARASELFGEPVRTVKSWRYRDRRPRPETAQKIVAATNGEVTLADIYGQPREQESA